MSQLIDQTKVKMVAALDHFKNELKNLRTGRASTGLVEHISVEVYGSPMRIKDIASISTPEPRLILIAPFDPQNSAGIAKAIERANLGFVPIVDANAVRIKVPPMTEETRKKMVKVLHEELEKAKVAIRNIRRDANDLVRRQKAAGELAEDVMKKTEKGVQELTDKFCKEAEEVGEKKEKEITTI